jgi:hypothetical protein
MEILEQETIKSALKSSMSYEQYRNLVDDLFSKGKATGDIQNESYLHYTDLNIHRMRKWEKHFKPQADVQVLLKQWQDEEIWLVITEGWCGDAAHALPVIHKLADLSPNIELRVVLRDENLELTDRFLTNGARSIPKLIRLTKDGDVLGTWGPRPALGQKIIHDAKANNTPMAEAKEALQLWYARDRGKAIEKELVTLLEIQ